MLKHSFVSVRLDDFLVWGEPLGQLGIPHGQLLRLLNLTLALVERLSLHLPLGLQGGHDVLVLPANLGEKYECNPIRVRAES